MWDLFVLVPDHCLCFTFQFIEIWVCVARTSIQRSAKKSEDGKIIQTSMKHFLLLLLRNATKHNSIKFSAAWLHISSEKIWNCLKDLKCNDIKKIACLVNKQTLPSTELKNICKAFYRFKM